MSGPDDPGVILSEATCSIEDLQRLLKIGKNQAYEAVAKGEFDAIRIGRGTIRVLCAPLRKKLRFEIEKTAA